MDYSAQIRTETAYPAYLCVVQLLSSELFCHEAGRGMLEVVEGRHTSKRCWAHSTTTVSSCSVITVVSIKLETQAAEVAGKGLIHVMLLAQHKRYTGEIEGKDRLVINVTALYR